MTAQRPDIPAPTWPMKARDHCKKRADLFHANLKAVSQSIASQDGVDSVSIRHVDEGHAALARVGLTPRKWYCRTEFEVGVGAF